MSLIHNERLKLLANALDRASTACLMIGIITPVAGYLYGLSRYSGGSGFLIAVLCVWLVAAVGLHLAARRVLGGLR
jgi:hypothetical protein